MIGRVLEGRYVLESLIGSGGMADVYRANDTILERAVAVKILHAEFELDTEFISRFHREAKAAARISHPNIIGVYDVGVAEGKHFIVMEYVPGVTLKEKIRNEGIISPQEALYIAYSVASALAQAHAAGLVHCDIKPHNILVMPNGVVKVADFGIARAVTESTLTYSENVLGSVHYFSPEQAKGTRITPKSDVYSLGVMLYEMLTGKLPFVGDTPVSIAMKHLQEEPQNMREINPDLPPMVEAIVTRAMTKDPALRPTSLEIMRDIEQAERLLPQVDPDEDSDDPERTRILPRLMGENGSDDESAKPLWKRKKFLIGLGMSVILVVGFFVGIFLSYGKFWVKAEVTVPDVTGKPVAEATKLLEEQNLRVKVNEVFDEKVEVGSVVAQLPEAGASVKEERLITISVSKGGEETVVPDVRGWYERDARKRLEELGLKVGSSYETFSEEDKGTIISQNPASGTKLMKGQSIDITVSRGSRIQKVTVPDVKGIPVVRATAVLAESKLKAGTISREESKQAEGTVIRQNPEAGSYIDEGKEVELVVAEPAKKSSKNDKETKNKDKDDKDSRRIKTKEAN